MRLYLALGLQPRTSMRVFSPPLSSLSSRSPVPGSSPTVRRSPGTGVIFMRLPAAGHRPCRRSMREGSGELERDLLTLFLVLLARALRAIGTTARRK